MDKGVLGGSSSGIIQSIFNDYGHIAAANFIDNLQRIINYYMMMSSYSVGISDLIADHQTNEAIADVISDKKKSVHDLIDQTHLGIFENKTGKTNEAEFETQVNNILNKATNEAGKIGRSSLHRDNRFVIMVNAGSKGSELNIAQMVSCLGQQNVDGKRIPYGYENRTSHIIQNLTIRQRHVGLLKIHLSVVFHHKSYSFMPWVGVLVLLIQQLKHQQQVIFNDV